MKLVERLDMLSMNSNFAAHGVDAKGSASSTPESASGKTKNDLVRNRRNPDMTRKPLVGAYYILLWLEARVSGGASRRWLTRDDH